MIDLGFAALLALITAGFGKRILDELGCSPEHPLDALALAIPLGMGLTALATLALGEFGYLDFVGISVVLAVEVELGIIAWFNLFRQTRAWLQTRVQTRSRTSLSLFFALCLGLVLAGTAVTSLTPVTDGDALCYHLQVPKVFLMHGSVGFVPDLHETIYPLLTEMLYAIALEFRGPVACRGIQWILGIVFAANVTALARPNLGRRAWWAGAFALAVPAVSNGMSAPLNDVALAAFGTAAIFAAVRFHERPGVKSAVLAGVLAGLAIGVKYPALVLVGLLAPTIALRTFVRPLPRQADAKPRWVALAGIYLVATLAAGGCWYLRAYVHTGNPVYPFFRDFFGGAGLAEVLDPIKRPLAVTPFNLLSALVPLSLQPDRFDSFSHQFGPAFLLFLPAIFLYRAPRRILLLVGLSYAFLVICLTQRQSVRFVLISLGPMSIGVAYVVGIWSKRRTLPARLLIVVVLSVMGLEASLAAVRSRHVLAVLFGRESAAEFLARREPTFTIGQWTAHHLPADARLIGQDHRGFYIPRDYTMELAHRRRTGLGTHGESSSEIVTSLRESGFTHVMFCPPQPDTAVEFDPTLGRLLAPWIAGQTALFREELTDGDGVVRQYTIYKLAPEPALAAPQRPYQQLSARSDGSPAR
jgi:Dolichyl-phosphate-mannose-protein mannosyltransferase